MVNHRNFIILFILVGAITIPFSQEYKITDFRVPYSKSYRLLVGGSVQNDWDNTCDLDILPHYKSYCEQKESDIFCDAHFLYDDPEIFQDYSHGLIDYSIMLGCRYRQYLLNSPFFITVDGSYKVDRMRQYDMRWLPWVTFHSGDLALALGVGHLRDGGYAVAALKINEILKKEGVVDRDLDRETIAKIVEALAGGSYFIFRHERYQRYLSTIIEEIIVQDPGFQGVIPIKVWFKIFDAVDYGVSYYNFKNDFNRWQRFFGSRFTVNITGQDITNSDYWGGGGIKFPFFNDIYYRPILDVKYEYEKPIDLRRQVSLGADYSIDGVDASHVFGPNARFGYGITDRLLTSVGTSVVYVFSTTDHPPPDYIRLPSDVSVIYYIEDHCYVSFNFDLELQFNQKYLPDRGYNVETYTSGGIEFDWRIF